MAEFQEVMRQWGRYCKGYTDNHADDCSGCPFEINGSCNSYAKDNAEYAEQIEKHVMSWAAEHPEPVYPTWLEWLQEMGVMTDIHDRLNNYKQVMEVCGKPLYSIPTTKIFCHIPADDAKKLGIEPKEG